MRDATGSDNLSLRSVQTQTSVYELDIKAMTATRLPGEAQGGFELSRLRRDGEKLRLVNIGLLKVGLPMVLVLDLRGDGVLTVRTTTPVRAINFSDGSSPL